jgi:hypothetical protein
MVPTIEIVLAKRPWAEDPRMEQHVAIAKTK